jgi:hypothetical protein
MGVHQELVLKWDEAMLTQRGGHEWRGVALSTAAPVRLMAAVREPDDRISLLIETALSLAPAQTLRFETQGLSLADQRRPVENVYRLAITLERNELRKVFEALCADLIAVASEAETPAVAISGISKRLDAWRVCLRTRRSGLTREEQVGLLGELSLFEAIGKSASYQTAVEAWQGPLDGIHDFVRGGSALEVKSVLGVGSHIYISRLDQLETDGISDLTVVRPRFRIGHDGRSLPQVIRAVRSNIEIVEPGNLVFFDEKLLMTGYLEVDEPMYEANLFVQEGVRYYTVSDGFPRITRQALPAGILDGSYIIDERSIEGFSRAESDFFQLLEQNFGSRL